MKLIYLLSVFSFFGTHAFADSCFTYLSRNMIHQIARTEFIDTYSSKVFRSTEQNINWVNAALVEKRKGLYIESTVSELKKLNDEIIKNKDLVTALVNLKKEYDLKFLLSIEGFQSAEIYSDYKTIRIFIPFDLDQNSEEIERVYQKVHQAFKNSEDHFRRHIEQSGLIRRRDLQSQWFHLGFAETADLASYAARSAKGLNQLTLNLFDPHEITRLENDRKKIIEMFNLLIANSWQDYLFTDDKSSFSLLTIEIYRKNKTPKKFATAIKDHFGFEMSEFSAQKIIDFFEMVDIFSPSLILTERTSVAIEVAHHGAFSLDFIGLGAKNLLATVDAVVHSRSIEDLFLSIRANENEVTRRFNSDKQIILKLVRDFFNYTGDINYLVRFSGDEGVILPNREIELSDLINLQKRILDIFGVSQIRITFMKSDRRHRIDTELVSLAESIEKQLRKNLVSKLEPALVNATQFNVWTLDEAQDGTRQVILTLYSRVQHSKNQRTALRSAFTSAVNTVNNSTNVRIVPLQDIYAELPK